ncbi:unnamed protein product [Chilo suppressalis]|uniref:V-type proton ATPase subunit n=1 Tax=Chilo suppressalis TaxID=168631 RepID=A0ABN8AYQ5_CHISP|nr:hypothetical protein evm_007250 [Chilo suppressalis]CAH0398006.1 unnamed protein product [Chilo suppressalis]
MDGNDGTTMAEVSHDNIYMPIYVLTAVFGGIFVIGPFLVPKRENRELIQQCIMMTAFCMWILWVTIYIAQMHPLTPPRLRNKTMAWLVNTNREPASPPSAVTETTEQPISPSGPLEDPTQSTTPDPRGEPPPPNP